MSFGDSAETYTSSRSLKRIGMGVSTSWMLCLAGGIAGIGLGRGVSYLVNALLNWPTMPSVPAIIAAVAVAATVGIVFGYYPAWKASRLDPIEALRYE